MICSAAASNVTSTPAQNYKKSGLSCTQSSTHIKTAGMISPPFPPLMPYHAGLSLDKLCRSSIRCDTIHTCRQ